MLRSLCLWRRAPSALSPPDHDPFPVQQMFVLGTFAILLTSGAGLMHVRQD